MFPSQIYVEFYSPNMLALGFLPSVNICALSTLHRRLGPDPGSNLGRNRRPTSDLSIWLWQESNAMGEIVGDAAKV